ncbi:MAG TPA: hypothetical protein VK614_15235 [Allosphingosinicella sp.]|nr:hypothetical protein [Allosphingosinicella sp.]
MLASGAFVVTWLDADDRIICTQGTGQLFYDADGNRSGSAVPFATLQAGTVLAASDFTVI